MTDIDFRRELAGLLNDEPVLGPDVTRALRGGRRAQARHRYVSSAAGLAGVAVIAGAVPLGLSLASPSGGSSGVTPAAGSSSPAPVAPSPVPTIDSHGATPAPVAPVDSHSATPSPVPTSDSAVPSPVPSSDTPTPAPSAATSVAASAEPTSEQGGTALPSPVPSTSGWKPTS